MDTQTNEQVVRREAVRRRLQGETRSVICADLGRSPAWFSKWWAEYQQNPQTDFADDSRAPHRSPHAIDDDLIEAVVNARKILEAAEPPATRYGLIGAPSVQTHLA
jgi:transposase-like protein